MGTESETRAGTGSSATRMANRGYPSYATRSTQWYDADLAWLDDRTILHHLSQPTGDVEFYTLDARTGRRSLVAVVSYEDHKQVTDFGVSAPGAFWYTTDDGRRMPGA